jgi:hypothetical protein
LNEKQLKNQWVQSELRTLKLTLRQEKNKLEESKHEMELELQRKLDEERKKSKSKFGIQNPNASK